MELSNDRFCQLCIEGDTQEVARLLDADPRLANASGSVRADHRDYMKSQGADSGWTALHLAAHYGQRAIVEMLVKAGANIEARSENRLGNTPLSAAIAGGDTEIVELLLAAGANPRAKDASGHDALALAQGGKNAAILDRIKAACE